MAELPGLSPHAAAWDALALSAPQRLPQLSHAWVRSYLETRDEAERFHALFAYDGERLVGVLPFVHRAHRFFGRMAPCLHIAHDEDTRAGDLLLADGCEREVLRALLEAAFRCERHCFGLWLAGVRETSSTWKALEGGAPRGQLERLEEPPGSYVRVEGTYEAFRDGLGDNFRRNLRKNGNRLGREPGVALRLLGGAEADPAHLDRFLELEASGWKGAKGTSISASPMRTRYYRALVARLAAAGWLEWHFLEIGGRLAAGHLGVRFGKALVLLKIAYDEAFSRLGPGSHLFDRVVEREFATGTSVEINCLSDMTWHRNWKMPQTTYEGVALFPKRPWPWLGGVLPERARRAAKRVPALRALGRKLQGEPPLPPPLAEKPSEEEA